MLPWVSAVNQARFFPGGRRAAESAAELLYLFYFSVMRKIPSDFCSIAVHVKAKKSSKRRYDLWPRN